VISIAAFPKCYLDTITNGEMDLFDWIDASVELEADGLELYAPFLRSHDSAYLGEVRRRIEAFDMRCPMMCYSPDFTIPDEAARKDEVRKQIEIARVTGELGGQFCRTLSGQRRPGVAVEQGIDWVVESLESCLPEVEKLGVTLVIENHYKDGEWKYPEFAQQKKVFLAVLDRVDDPRLGVQYDPSNALVAGDDPIDVLDAVLPRVKTVHASDRYLLPDTSLEEMRQADGTLGYPDKLVHGVTGQGENDYDTIFSKLVAAGFDGWISIEDGMNGMDEMKASIEFLKRMREKYDGAQVNPLSEEGS
jgi:sugar phosphate isomerase/epimerase